MWGLDRVTRRRLITRRLLNVSAVVCQWIVGVLVADKREVCLPALRCPYSVNQGRQTRSRTALASRGIISK